MEEEVFIRWKDPIIEEYKKEITRLNNIINELEKWLEYEIYCNFNEEMTKGYQDTLNQLKELKVGDKE